MPDNDSQSNQEDGETINLHEPLEVEYWATHFGITEIQLRAVVGLLGASSADVERYLNATVGELGAYGQHLGYEIETTASPTGTGKFRGAFRIFAASGSAMALIHADDGRAASSFRSEDLAIKDAADRADRWIFEHGGLGLKSKKRPDCASD